jgi:hypothetical protein
MNVILYMASFYYTWNFFNQLKNWYFVRENCIKCCHCSVVEELVLKKISEADGRDASEELKLSR